MKRVNAHPTLPQSESGSLAEALVHLGYTSALKNVSEPRAWNQSDLLVVHILIPPLPRG